MKHLPRPLLVLLILCTVAARPAIAQSFNAFEASTPAGALSGVIKTKIAGGAFSVSTGALRVIALNTLGQLDTGFNGTVTASLIDSSAACTTKKTLAALGNVPLSAGTGTLDPAVAGAYASVRIQISWISGKDTFYGCSNDPFAIRPAVLNVVARDKDWTSAGTARTLDNASATAGVVHAAGQPFALAATAQNLDGSVAADYAGAPTVAALDLLLPDPAQCTECVVGALNLGTWSAKDGVLTSSTASYTEVGSIALALADTTFAAIDTADSTLAERSISSNTATIGRFVPSAFQLQLGNAPELRSGGSNVCTPRNLTYLGQPFGYAIAPSVLVAAHNAAGNPLTNYWATGGLASLNSPLSSASTDCAAHKQTCVQVRRDAMATTQLTSTYAYTSTDALPGWYGEDAAHLVIDAATLQPYTQTTGRLLLPADDRITLFRPVEPVGPFLASITLALALEDFADSTSLGGPDGNPDMIAGNLAATLLPFDFGNGLFTYGRTRLFNAYGPGQFDLAMPMQVEYWESAATGWRIAGNDHCTGSGSDPASAVSLQLVPAPGWTGGTPCVRDLGSPGLSGAGCADLAIPERRFTKPPDAGRFNLWLAAPGSGISGRVVVTAQVPEWLRWNWTGTVGNPVSAATFGIDRQRPILFRRELY